MKFEKENMNYTPTNTEISEYVNNYVYDIFCNDIMEKYNISPIFEFSKCSMEYGWNIKFKKSGKSLCTIYPREGFFTVLVVVGKKEKEAVENLLNLFSNRIQKIYYDTKEGIGQKWLMIDLEDKDKVYEDIMKIIEIRIKNK